MLKVGPVHKEGAIQRPGESKQTCPGLGPQSEQVRKKQAEVSEAGLKSATVAS
jgi:hypothetical protein